MAKLISLEGANVTLPSGLSINSNSNMIYSISGEISYEATSGIPIHLTDDFTQIAFGYNLGTDVPSANLISYVTGTGVKTRISTDYNVSLLDLSGNDVTNENLIQWLLDINATIEGGIYEEEHTVQIINPQMYILPPTKVVGNDLVVSAEEVVVNEATYGDITISFSSFSTLTFNHTKSDGTIVETKTASSGTVTFDNIASNSYINITGTMNMIQYTDEVNCTFTHGNNTITITNIGENATITFLNSD